MDRKALIISLSALAVLVIAAIVGISVLYHDGGHVEPKVKTVPRTGYSLLEAVPSDAVMLLASGSAKDVFELVTDSTKVFSVLMGGNPSRGFGKFAKGCRGLLKNTPAVISLHYSGELMPLMIIKAGRDTSYDLATVMAAADSAGLVCSKVQEDYMEICYSQTLISSSERNLKGGSSILDDEDFARTAAAAPGSTALFVDHSYASKIFASFLRKPYYDSWNFFSKAAEWSAWAVGGDSPKQFLLDVISSTAPGDFRHFSGTITPAESKLVQMLPATTFFAVSMPVEEYASFIAARKSFLDASGDLASWNSRNDSMKDSTKVTPAKWAERLDVKEIGKAIIRTGNGLKPVVFIRPGKEDAEILLRGTGLQTLKQYKPAVVPYAWKGFAGQVFGRIFSCEKELFFTWKDGWIVVGDDDVVTSYATGDVLKNPLKGWCADNGVTVDHQSGLLAWFSPSEGRDMLPLLFEKPLETALRQSLEGISAAPMVLDIKGNAGQLTVNRVRVAQVTSAVAASTDTTVNIPQGPFKVKNCATGKTNTLSQSANLTLTLKDENGKSLWGVPFKGRLCGRVATIDWYANGKLQFLFAAGSKLYLIDRLGRFVSPFPADLGKQVRLGPDAYDFTGAKGYSAMVLHTDNTLALYDLHGKKKDGWKDITGKDTIKDLPELLTVKGKKYWVVRTASGTDIYPFLGGDPITDAKGDKAFRHDAHLVVKDASVSGPCYDGKTRSVKIKDV